MTVPPLYRLYTPKKRKESGEASSSVFRHLSFGAISNKKIGPEQIMLSKKGQSSLKNRLLQTVLLVHIHLLDQDLYSLHLGLEEHIVTFWKS